MAALLPPTTVWLPPTSHDDPDTVWTDETNAYDGNTATYAKTYTTDKYLELYITETYCDRVRVFAKTISSSDPPGETDPDIDIDVYYGAAWHNIYSGSITKNTWVEKTIGSRQEVTGVRVKSNEALYYTNPFVFLGFYLYEVAFGSYSFDTVCRIAFDTAPFAATPTWTDVSADYVTHSSKWGRQHQLARIQATECSILLRNEDGNYWPLNSGGDYYPNVDIGKKVNLRFVYNGITYDRFTGYIRQWQPTWFEEIGLTHPGMILDCADAQHLFSIKKLNDGSGYSQEASGTRVDNVLDDVGYPAADRDLDAGTENMLASGAISNTPAQQHLYSVQESEAGLLFQDPAGIIVFQEKGARQVSPYDTSQGTFGIGNNPIWKPELPFDDDLLYNEAYFTRVGGSEQSATDPTSITAYGPRTISNSGLLLTTDTKVLEYAQDIVYMHKDPRHRVRAITIYPQETSHAATVWPLVLGLYISDRITVVWTEAGINNEYHIEGGEESFDYREGKWETKWQLSDAEFVFPVRETVTLEPNGNGDTIQWTPIPGTGEENWEDVATEDGSSYVRTSAANATDKYDLEDVVSIGPILKLTVYAKAAVSAGSGNGLTLKLLIGGDTLTGSEHIVTTTSLAFVSDSFDVYGDGYDVDDINAMQVMIICSYNADLLRVDYLYVDVETYQS